MVCSTAILSSTLALALLRHSSPPSQSFVLSPFSLNTALSIIHDGANGTTQKELTNLLLNGCSPADVTNFYSSLALSIPSTNTTGVSFKSANRFYVDYSVSLNDDYEKHIQSKYSVMVKNIKLDNKIESAYEMNQFVNEATNGMIKDVFKPEAIPNAAVFINAIHFLGKWKIPFDPSSTTARIFKGGKGERKIDFMKLYEERLRLNVNNEFGTVLIMPYKDEKYNFFYLMPNVNTTLEKMRNELNGEKLINVIKRSTYRKLNAIVPKFKIESKLDGAEVLKKLGVKSLFNNADLSKISSTPLQISKIQQNAVIEIDEEGTEAAASTFIGFKISARPDPPTILIDRPFIFGVIRNDDILFIGQYV